MFSKVIALCEVRRTCGRILVITVSIFLVYAKACAYYANKFLKIHLALTVIIFVGFQSLAINHLEYRNFCINMFLLHNGAVLLIFCCPHKLHHNFAAMQGCTVSTVSVVATAPHRSISIAPLSIENQYISSPVTSSETRQIDRLSIGLIKTH